MTKNEYLFTLETNLHKASIADADEIIAEYEQHFAFKTADGLTEEEISARLESPDLVAAHYEGIKTGEKIPTGKIVIKIAMGALAVLEAMIYFVFGAWIFAIGAAAFACLLGGIALIINLNVGFMLSAIQPMPTLTAIVHGVALLSLGAVFAGGTYICYKFLKQIVTASIRWHAIVTGQTALPSLPWVPEANSVSYRKLKKILIISLIAFGVTSVLAVAVGIWQAGAFEYWHVWGWFI